MVGKDDNVVVGISPLAHEKRLQARHATDRLNQLFDDGGSYVGEVRQTYNRYYGSGSEREPSQDDSEMRLVKDALMRINESVEQIDITDGHTAILLRDGNRTSLMLDVGDTPVSLEFRLRRALQKIPVKYADADVARGIEKCFVEDAEELLQEEDPQARAKRLGLRIERGGLE